MFEYEIVKKSDPMVSLFGGRVNLFYQVSESLDVAYSRAGARNIIERLTRESGDRRVRFVVSPRIMGAGNRGY